MSTLKNKVQLIGNVGNEPEITNLESGKKVAKFSIATNESYKDSNGEKVTNTQWHNIVAWGKIAEIVEKYVGKGKEKLGNVGITLDEAVLELLFEGQKALGIEKTYSIEDAKLIRGYDSQGYGVVTSNERHAIKELAQNEGILLDPVYSGRAFYGMLDHLENKKLRNNANVLFWHTGGLPANFYYSKELR